MVTDNIHIPYLNVVHSYAPRFDINDTVCLSNAETGMMFNEKTLELYGGLVKVVPVHCHGEFKVWKGCQSGDELVGTFDGLGQAMSCKQSQETPGDYRVEDASYYICLLLKTDGFVEEIAVSNAVIGLTASRKWRSLIRMAGSASFSRVYELSTLGHLDIYSPGNCYPVVSINGFTDERICRRAKELYKKVATRLLTDIQAQVMR